MPGELGFDTGPYVTVATFCERAMQEKDGVVTLVRLVDQVTINAQGEGATEDLPPGTHISTTLVVGLKPGQARGKQIVTIVVEHPDGSRHAGPELPAHFTQAPNTGENFILNIALELSTPGVYWADVLVNARLVTRVPLEVRYQVTQPGIQLS